MPAIVKNSPIIPELFSMLNEPKTVPIILKLCQHNWEKPNGGIKDDSGDHGKRLVANQMEDDYNKIDDDGTVLQNKRTNMHYTKF